MDLFSFKKAVPIWPIGMEKEMNILVAFEEKTYLPNDADIYISASTFYRIFVNGKFVSFGPARTAKGYARVDVISLDGFCTGEINTIRIEVISYNCRSLSTCKESGFLCAEIRQGEETLYYTGHDFKSYLVSSKIQCAERFSVQRHFGEIWDFGRDDISVISSTTENVPVFLNRIAPYPHYEDIFANGVMSVGDFFQSADTPEQSNLYSWDEIPEYWGRFEEEKTEKKPYRWIISQDRTTKKRNENFPLKLSEGEFAVFDLKKIECGFLLFDIKSQIGADAVIGFSEFSETDEFSFTTMHCQNVIECIFPSEYNSRFISLEPNTLRYAIIMVKSKSLEISSFGIKTFERNMNSARAESFSSKIHQKIYNSAIRTFAHNAVDIYTDCPSRERAGWLCDSYFTGCAEYHFFGKVPTEDAFLENYILFNGEFLPDGILPMCYPADIIREPNGTGRHIPQWCMWYILEVKEYLTLRNTSVNKEIFRKSVEGIIGYLEKFENSDGLLQNIPSWNFVEWSKANEWTQDVNYPTNFLYSAALFAAYQLYGNEALKEKSQKLKKRTAELSFDGEFFTDNAILNGNGILTNAGNISEACQYYALLFGDIDIHNKKYSKLKEFILQSRKHDNIEPVNAFIGFYLRLKYLLEIKEYKLLLDDIESFFGNMADSTETLWEYRDPVKSLDHGFASYAAYAMCVALENQRNKAK